MSVLTDCLPLESNLHYLNGSFASSVRRSSDSSERAGAGVGHALQLPQQGAQPLRSTIRGLAVGTSSGAGPGIYTGRTNVIHLLWMFIVGLVVGAVAKLFVPGVGHLGIVMTAVLGIVGSIVGGFIARLFSRPTPGAPFHPAGILLSIIGAVIVLWAWTHLAH